MITHSHITLGNGTRVVLVPHRDTAAATLLALYEVGSRYETAALSGASHYIEHMMFKGTERRPNTMAISRDLDAVGADYNAFTGKDLTGYYIRLQAEKLGLAVDMLEDMLYHSSFKPKDVESERKVIHEELRMYDDNPMMVVEERMEEELYKGSSLGWRVGGTVKTMNGITRGGLTGYRDRHYVPAKTVLALAGRFERDEAVALLERTFGKVRPRKAPAPFKPFTAKLAGPRVRVEWKDTEQVQLAMGWPAYRYGDPRLAALKMMSIILGGTMSSRLFMSVREKRGLAYSVSASTNPYQDVGNITVQAGLSKDRFHDAMKVIMAELAKMKAKDVTSEELNRAKEFFKGKMVLNLEESSRLADWYARQELLQRRIETPEERIAKAFAVTKADIRRAANDVFRRRTAAIAVIGPFKDPAPIAKHLSAL
ncbi:MAG TPA: pitrilysin family protein [Candidatus Eisenbacteria bacterium]|jgi:predicted Zn-dependent peptidase|nr:pitrilysin family protein [Candidatus Eisenbacteria bacterium]